MYKLGDKAERSSRLPSECVPGLVEEIGEWGVYCFDDAILYFVRVIQNALQEREQIGLGAQMEWRQKYTLAQLLDKDFRLPRPPSATVQKRATGAAVKAMFGSEKPRRKRGKGNAIPGLVQQWLERRKARENDRFLDN